MICGTELKYWRLSSQTVLWLDTLILETGSGLIVKGGLWGVARCIAYDWLYAVLDYACCRWR